MSSQYSYLSSAVIIFTIYYKSELRSNTLKFFEVLWDGDRPNALKSKALNSNSFGGHPAPAGRALPNCLCGQYFKIKVKCKTTDQPQISNQTGEHYYCRNATCRFSTKNHFSFAFIIALYYIYAMTVARTVTVP